MLLTALISKIPEAVETNILPLAASGLNKLTEKVVLFQSTPLSMTKVTTFIDKIPGWIQPIGYSLAGVFAICAFIQNMTGTEGSSKAKKWLANILFGLCGIFLAGSILLTIKSSLE